MTNREFFVAVADANLSDEMTLKAQELIASLDKRNDKRKSADSKEKQETVARRQLVLSYFKENPNEIATRSTVATATGLTEGQVTSACTALFKEGLLTRVDAKIDKSKKTVYSLAK